MGGGLWPVAAVMEADRFWIWLTLGSLGHQSELMPMPWTVMFEKS